ncbi:MAG: carbohydrate ABC transporter permease [Aggregatilineales bacterium]
MLTTRERLLLLAPLALIVGPFLLWPLLYGFILTFTNAGPFQPSPRFVGLTNYLNVLSDDTFRTALVNMVVFTGVTVMAEMFLGVATAFVLRKLFQARSLLRVALLLPWLLSPSASGVMWHYLLDNQHGLLIYWATLFRLPPPPYLLGLDTSYWTVIFTEIWRKTPLVIFLVLPGLLAIPTIHWDQAKIERLSRLEQALHIVLPRLRLLLLTIMLLMIGDGLGMSESIVFLTGGGPGSATMTPGVYSYNQAIVAQNWTAGGTPGWFIAGSVLSVGIVYLRLARRLKEP